MASTLPFTFDENQRKKIENSLMSSDLSSPTIFSGNFSDDEWSNENLSEIEFRSPEDEAWYGVEVPDMCDALWVSFNGFSYKYDEFYPAEYFKNSDEIQVFEERFRATSVQMQDIECPKVNEGTKVCATCPSVTGEVKFYDAIIGAVERTKHGRDEEGNEVCGCNFRVYWEKGPLVDQMTCAKVGDICLRPEDNRMNPVVVSFLKEARRKLHGGACLQGEETEWQKILKKVNSAIRNNMGSSVPE